VIGSERTVEAKKLSTTSRGQERYPNGVALTIPAEGALTLPTGAKAGAAKSWFAGGVSGKASIIARPGRR
jgi:hypothetical protein